MKAPAALALLALLAACGQRESLHPKPGDSLPPAPLGRADAPGAEELLSPPTVARPGRTEEILTRSEERETDRFDLPPT
ncbi:MAG TPA: hypothetical protein VI381_02480 [Allosphingosinicella sp.]